MLLELEAIQKSYGGQPVLRGVSLALEAGSITALLGPSGCGKTTLLRIVAGLDRPDQGVLRCGGASLAGIAPHQRGFGLMFQDYALFPHLDVAGNVGFGLRMAGLDRAASQARVLELLELVGLQGYGQRRVYQLSGGERQRVALARALAPRPRLLMLDEPLAALDRSLRERLQEELRAILRTVGVTALYVTHDQEEAFALADRVALLNAGRLEQYNTPEVVYHAPASTWAARFLGLGNLVHGHWRADGRVETALGALACRSERPPGVAGTPVSLVIYPEAARPPEQATSGLPFTIGETQFRGRAYRVLMHHPAGVSLSFDLSAPLAPPGNVVSLGLDPQGVYALPSEITSSLQP